MTQDELLKKREQVLLKLMEDPMYQPMRLQDIAVFLDVPKSKRKDLESALDALVREGRIRVSKNGKYGKSESQEKEGVFAANAKGFGFVRIPGEENDVFIPRDKTRGALQGDTVRILIPRGQQLERREGRVLEIVARGVTRLVGYYRRENRSGVVLPDNTRFAADVINPDNSKMEGIRIVGEEFGFSMDQVMAFGDSDNDLEMLSGVGLSIAMGNGTSRVKEVAQHTTTSNTKDGIQKALEHFGIITDQSLFVSRDDHFNKVKAFHQLMDGQTQEEPKAWDNQEALYRTMFKQEELVEFIRAASKDETTFDRSIESLHQALDEAANKVRSKHPAEISMVGQVDALIDTLYLTYGSFVLMGVDPEEVFEIVHRANMGKIFPDGKAHFDEVTHKILKPDDWEEKYAPEPAIQKELERQIKAYQKHCSEKTAESEENKKV